MELLFVYGTLQPGASHWHLLRPWVNGPPRPAELPGVLYDTGRGYPALELRPDGPRVSGWVVELRSPSEPALAAMDSYEGAEYRRERVALADGTGCWTYVWIVGFDGLHPLREPWPAPGSGDSRAGEAR
ncbi:gamma-glutamylcyclotransferase family protein [Actinophytocola sp.]|uniref:gamma-glutamylcyclotransferase family protein n=1 Tax=Actinophytocola sp. TaxID=1872138 RepID=UPI002D7E1C5E|nr:gamma-glutamylcyclotransferase family protein [Actinophytocola sp.]HET9140631.1 gamma-glutamylcyclotransferase family protein [Actinophytocola sp.]